MFETFDMPAEQTEAVLLFVYFEAVVALGTVFAAAVVMGIVWLFNAFAQYYDDDDSRHFLDNYR